jgi:hypothetical protein
MQRCLEMWRLLLQLLQLSRAEHGRCCSWMPASGFDGFASSEMMMML